MRCPICNAELKITLLTNSSVDAKVDVITEINDTHGNVIRDALLRYWRWVAEGKKAFREEQYYYDDYHKQICHIKDSIYECYIQIYDGPLGDTWLRKRFEVSGGCHIIMLPLYKDLS